MKISIFLQGIIITFILLSFQFCGKKTDHSVRVKNNSTANFADVKMGPANFGSIKAGATSDYKNITEGSHTFSATVELKSSVFTLSNPVPFSGKGKHKWTYILDNQFTPSMVED